MFATINVKMNSLNQRFFNSSSEDVTMSNHISRTFSDTGSESEIGRKAWLKTRFYDKYTLLIAPTK